MARHLILGLLVVWILWERVETFQAYSVTTVFRAPVEGTDTRAECARLAMARLESARHDGQRTKAYDEVQVSVVGDVVYQRVRMWTNVSVMKSTYGCLPVGMDPPSLRKE